MDEARVTSPSVNYINEKFGVKHFLFLIGPRPQASYQTMSPEKMFLELIFDAVAGYFQAVKRLDYCESQMHYYVFPCNIIINNPAELI